MSKTITYTVAVTVTDALTDDPHHPDFYTEAQATSATHRHELERRMRVFCRSLGADVDVEMTNWTVTDDDPHGGECACEKCRIERVMP